MDDSNSAPSASTDDASRPRRRRWKTLAIILAAWVGLVAYAQFGPTIGDRILRDGSERFIFSLITSIICGGLVFLWIVLNSGLSRRGVAIVLILAAAIVVAMGRDFRQNRGLLAWRLTGVKGDIIPTFEPRWGADRPPPVVIANDAAAVDLTTTTPNDFPQFLGPNRDGTLTGVALARDWDKQPPKLRWRQPIGLGWSSFAVVGNHAVAQEQRDGGELVVCYELETGKVAWQHADSDAYTSVIAGDGPRATPTIAGGRVYTLGSTGRLNCLDGATGERIWTRHFQEEFGVGPPEWGRSSSPLVVEGKVVMNVGAADGKSLVAFDVETGEVVWSAGDDKASYASPMIATLAGRRQIVIVNEESVTGHDIDTGEILWRYPWPGKSPKVAQPLVISDNQLLLSAGYGVGCVMLQFDMGEDGSLRFEEAWTSRTMKPKFTNVLHFDGYIYGFDDGVLACISAKDGKRQWRRGRYGHGQTLLVDNLLLASGESGEVVLVEARPDEFVELARIEALTGKTWNVPTLAGRILLLRNDQEAVCFELP